MPDLDDWSRKLAEAGGGELSRLVRRELVRGSLEAEAGAKRIVTRRLSMRSGRLRNSIHGFVRGEGALMEMGVRAGGQGPDGKPVRYAAIQERGGVVRPTRSRYLAIPLSSARTRAGVARYEFARQDPTPMYFRRSRDGRAFLFARDGSGPRYRLVDSVRIRGRHFLRDGLKQAARRLPLGLHRAVRLSVEVR